MNGLAVIEFVIDAAPVAKGRPRTGRHPRTGAPLIFTPAKTRQAEQDIVAIANQYAPRAPLEGPLRLELEFVLPIPGSRPAWWRSAASWRGVLPTTKPDLDNLVKGILDALQRSGRWFRDDSQVAELYAEKVYGSVPLTRVKISQLTEWSSPRRAQQQRERQDPGKGKGTA